MRVTFLTYTSVALDANGIANDVAYSGGGYALTADGANDGLAHLITILNNSLTDHSGKTFTVAGTDANGSSISEDLAGPAASSTVTTTRHFKTVTSVTVDSTTGADTFDIGWTAESVGADFYPDFTRSPVINAGLFFRITDTPTYTLQSSGDRSPGVAPAWVDDAVIVSKSANATTSLTIPTLAIRLKFTAAGTVGMTVIEPYRA